MCAGSFIENARPGTTNIFEALQNDKIDKYTVVSKKSQNIDRQLQILTSTEVLTV